MKTRYFTLILIALALLGSCAKEEAHPNSIYAQLKARGGFERSLQAMDLSGLAARYQDPQAQIAFFAITDAGWSSYFKSIQYLYNRVDQISSEYLADILEYHTIPLTDGSPLSEGYVHAEKKSDLFPTLPITAYYRNGHLYNHPARSIEQLSSWQLYSMDELTGGRVAVQSIFMDPNVSLLAEALAANPSTTISLFLEVIRKEALVFLPTNQAMQDFLDELGLTSIEELSSSQRDQLYYACFTNEPSKLEKDFSVGQQISIAWKPATVVRDGAGRLGLRDWAGREAYFVKTDIISDNGVTHLIDRVIGME